MRSPRPTPVLVILVLAALLVAACGGSAPGPAASPSPSVAEKASVVPVIVSSRQAVGENRFLFSFVDAETNTPAGLPDRTATVAFVPPGSSTASDPVEATFVWAIPDQRGVYLLRTDFASAGEWTAVFITKAPGGVEERIAMRFDVAEDSPAVAVGEPAPASDTPTADDVDGDLDRLSTDTDPDPSFYTTSVADALAANQPFVLAFATPAFCQTAQCGPTLDSVKTVAPDYPEVTFINVEPYRLEFTEGRLQPVLTADGRLDPVPSVLEYGILTEPWVYVVDGDGIVRASLEGVFSEDELRDALDAVAP
jgi:hypothetical protein